MDFQKKNNCKIIYFELPIEFAKNSQIYGKNFLEKIKYVGIDVSTYVKNKILHFMKFTKIKVSETKEVLNI